MGSVLTVIGLILFELQFRSIFQIIQAVIPIRFNYANKGKIFQISERLIAIACVIVLVPVRQE